MARTAARWKAVGYAVVALGAFRGAASLAAQSPETANPVLPEIAFRFERAGLPVPKFALRVRADGSGRYEADEAMPPMQDGSAAPMQHIDRPITLSPKTTESIFKATHALKDFSAPCASPAKNIADTGTKTLSYRGLEVQSCTYNYSDDKRVVQLTELFLAIAATLDMGRKLDFDHRFDRLGLDAASARLVEEVAAGRAIELGAISATLRSIAGDSEILERVRVRATKLLLQAQPTS